MSTDKALEATLRRRAVRQGLRLEKSRRRDSRPWDFGTYQLVDIESNQLRASGLRGVAFGLSIDDVEVELDASSDQEIDILAYLLR